MKCGGEFGATVFDNRMALPDVLERGTLLRVSGAGKRDGSAASRCKRSPLGMSGSFGDFPADLMESSQAKRQLPMALVERGESRHAMERANSEMEANRAQDQPDVVTRAAGLWEEAPSAAAPFADNYPRSRFGGVAAKDDGPRVACAGRQVKHHHNRRRVCQT